MSVNQIVINSLSKVYDNGFNALKKVSLEVKQGEILAMLGPNGAGKTTLISIICGIVTPSSGTVMVDGFDIIKDYRETRSRIGMVPQELSLESFETVFDTVSYSRGLYGKSPKPEHIEKILKDLSLWDKKDQRLRQLSGGMKRRVLIAKALSHEPSILFLDEPTAGVDVELRQEMWKVVKSLRETGVTIILTTHYLEEAEKLCKNISIIDQGKIVKTSSMNSLLKELESEIYVFEMKQTVPHDLKLDNLKINKIDEMTISVAVGKSKGIDEVLKIFQSNNIEINSIHNETNRLEELFLKLTNQI